MSYYQGSTSKPSEEQIREQIMAVYCLRTILPLCGLSVISATVSPVLPSYKKILESDPTLAKRSPDGAYCISCTNLVCVLMV